MAQGAGIRPWKRGDEAARAASTTVIPNGDLIVTDEGNVYAGNGTAQAKNLVRIARLSDVTAEYALRARDPESMFEGAITRNSNGVPTSAGVKWPDGTVGTFTADTVSTTFPGNLDAWHVTYGNPVTRTYTQPAVTRNASGDLTAQPAIVVS